VYQPGTYLRFKQGGNYKYAVVKEVAFSTNTTVTIFTNTDHTISNSAITDNDYSYQSNPQGFPQWFNFSPTWTGFSVAPAGGIYRYKVTGRMITLMIQPTSGVSNSTSTAVSVPVATSDDTHMLGNSYDNGAWQSGASPAYLPASSTTMNLYKNTNQTNNWTNTGAKAWYGVVSYKF